MAEQPVVGPDPAQSGTAASQASAAVPIAAPEQLAGAVRTALEGHPFVSASHVVVCDDGRFQGLVRIEDLLAAPPDVTMRALMDAEAPVVAPEVDQVVGAWVAMRHEETALAVVDGAGRFLGLVPPARLLEVLLAEHEEDLSRLGGFARTTAAARATSEEPVARRFRHRLPWLLFGLGGALVAAEIVGWFETELREQVILAFFIPGLVYLADAVGTQTETIVVRGLSVGVTMRRMVRRELWVGVAIGVTLAVLAGPLVYWRWGETDVALAVALSVFAACSTATIAAMALPWVFDSLSMDPAFGSGPLATVIQDLATILIYFAIASAIVK